jgi:hypothetical protein
VHEAVTRGGHVAPARVFGPAPLVSPVILARDPITEVATRVREPLKLTLPRSPRRFEGVTASLAVHALLILLLAYAGRQIWNPTLLPGQPGGSAEATAERGGGGSRVAYITLPSAPEPQPRPAPKPVPALPVPKPVVTPPPEPEELELASLQPVDTLASTTQRQPPLLGGSAPGAVTGAGTGPGAGTGAGPGAAGGGGNGPGGEGGKARPPTPRDMAFPFDTPPKELRGLSLNVTFWVRDDGKVERYVVKPEIKDRDYARKFDEVMRAFRFIPARAPDGHAVAGTTTIVFTLPGKHSS